MTDQEFVTFDTGGKKRKFLPRRFYTIQQVLLGVFLGGPLAGFFMMRRNYIAMGEEDKASVLGFWGFISIFPLVFILLLLPENVPAVAVQIVLCTAFSSAVNRSQQVGIQAMQDTGWARRFTYWRAVGSALVAAAITFGIGVLVVLAIGEIAPDLYKKMFPEMLSPAPGSGQAQVR